MKFVSTRSASMDNTVTISQAIEAGLAPDGGLYVPEHFPQWDGKSADPVSVLKPFFSGDVLEPHLDSICSNAFNFEIPVRELKPKLSVMELFHGPTAAFKDVGARFLAECQGKLNSHPRLIMVATSGDTGGAVAAAFHRRPNVEVIILFPKGMVSARQKLQLTCWGDNITAYEVRGSFDDCQRMVKEAFSQDRFQKRSLTSANSINVGRLLPQMTYYAKASVEHFQKTGQRPGFIIPSGNLGNAVAAFWAKKSGYPIAKILMATNANRAIPDYLDTGVRTPHSTIATLANAMDVGNPSNLERAIQLYPVLTDFHPDGMALSVSDAEISEVIQRWSIQGEVFCPHTATGIYAWEHMEKKQDVFHADPLNTGTNTHWLVAATAHPAKFETVVEPLIGKPVPIPSSLEQILKKPSTYQEIDPDLNFIA